MDARLLLVHSPLVGRGTWEPIAQDLAGDGYGVSVPDLGGTVTDGRPYHSRLAEVIADSAGGQPAVLIGHSGAGPLLATAGIMLGEQARGYVFVDAGLPTPGRSRLPLALFEEAQPPAPGWPNAPGGYIQLSEAYDGEAARAGRLGWPVRKQLSHHLALLTAPGQLAREVRKLTDRLLTQPIV
jgi:pimeloyl-ACP methyl ester carboxylesterase